MRFLKLLLFGALTTVFIFLATPCDHDYKLAYQKRATCTDYGSQTYFCTKCHKELELHPKPLGHNYQLIESKQATLYSGASETYECCNCKDSYTIQLSKKLLPVQIDILDCRYDSNGYAEITYKLTNRENRLVRRYYIWFEYYDEWGNQIPNLYFEENLSDGYRTGGYFWKGASSSIKIGCFRNPRFKGDARVSQVVIVYSDWSEKIFYKEDLENYELGAVT